MSTGLSSVKSNARCKPSAGVKCLLAASVTRDNQGSSLNDLWMRWLISSGVNHQLESRMREICQSGSEGGAKLTFVPTPISAQEDAETDFEQEIAEITKRGRPSPHLGSNGRL